MQNYSNQMQHFLNKITVLVCMTMFENNGSSSDDNSDSNRSCSESSLRSVMEASHLIESHRLKVALI